MKKENFDIQDLKNLEQFTNFFDAKEYLKNIILKSSVQHSDHPMRKEKTVYLLNISLTKAKNINDLLKIGYNMLLSGEKLSVTNSKYFK